MREVLVFAESAPDDQQRVWLLDRLEELRQRPVICQVHLRPVRATPSAATDRTARNGAAAGRGRLPSQTEPADAPGESSAPEVREERDVDLREARRLLHDLVELVRDAGHVAHGELLAGPLIRALTRGIAERSPDEVLLLTSDHRLELLLRRDLELRVRHAASVPVRVLEGTPGRPRR